MKKQMRTLLAGMMIAAALFGGCGNEENPAPEQEQTADGGQAQSEGSQSEASQSEAFQSEDSQSEDSQQDETSEPPALEEPYVLVRETYTKDGTVTEYAYDANGDKISETVTYPDKPDETLFREYTTQYQEDGSKL